MSESPLPSWIADHVKLYQTDPEKAHMWDASQGDPNTKRRIPTLLLTTKGRKSGKAIPTPLIYSPQGKGFAVIASKGGAPDHPAWYLNIENDPNVEVQVGAAHYNARARTVTDAERDKIWADMRVLYPPYDDYQAKTARTIPVVVFEPA